jgi:hypothetical protein
MERRETRPCATAFASESNHRGSGDEPAWRELFDISGISLSCDLSLAGQRQRERAQRLVDGARPATERYLLVIASSTILT